MAYAHRRPENGDRTVSTGDMDARALYPDSSLADLYDEVTMPVELRRAHQQNDKAVMAAYGFPRQELYRVGLCGRLNEDV
jgi:hypothetical protein